MLSSLWAWSAHDGSSPLEPPLDRLAGRRTQGPPGTVPRSGRQGLRGFDRGRPEAVWCKGLEVNGNPVRALFVLLCAGNLSTSQTVAQGMRDLPRFPWESPDLFDSP